MPRKKKIDPVSEAALEIVSAEHSKDESSGLQKESREQLIAECYRMVGRMEATDLISKTVNVYELSWLKQVKELKIYKDVPGIETWEGFCKQIGRSRTHLDRQLADINTFGEEFLQTIERFKVSYRDLQKLRLAVSEGDVEIQEGTVKIDQKEIPLDSDHASELQAAIELVIDEKNKAKADLDKVKKKQDAIIKEETKALKTERDALNKEVQRLKAFDPEDKDPDTWSIEQIEAIDEAARSFDIMCRKFIMDDRIEDDIPLQARVEGVMRQVEMTFKELRDLWEERFDIYND